jgi:hypothetical protein
MKPTLKAGLRFMKAEKVAFMEVVRESSMSWQWMGVRYSSTSTAVAWNMLRRPLTPAGIKASEMASTYINATALRLHLLPLAMHRNRFAIGQSGQSVTHQSF